MFKILLIFLLNTNFLYSQDESEIYDLKTLKSMVKEHVEFRSIVGFYNKINANGKYRKESNKEILQKQIQNIVDYIINLKKMNYTTLQINTTTKAYDAIQGYFIDKNFFDKKDLIEEGPKKIKKTSISTNSQNNSPKSIFQQKPNSKRISDFMGYKNLRLFFAEDNEEYTYDFKLSLQLAGLENTDVANFKEDVLEKLEATTYDFIILDYSVGEQNFDNPLGIKTTFQLLEYLRTNLNVKALTIIYSGWLTTSEEEIRTHKADFQTENIDIFQIMSKIKEAIIDKKIVYNPMYSETSPRFVSSFYKETVKYPIYNIDDIMDLESKHGNPLLELYAVKYSYKNKKQNSNEFFSNLESVLKKIIHNRCK